MRLCLRILVICFTRQMLLNMSLRNIEQHGIDQTCPKIQRNLQLRIEEQGRYLQMMFEKQCKAGMGDMTKTFALGEAATQSSDVTQSVTGNTEANENKDELRTDQTNSITIQENSRQGF
ncbi:hypothetical protein QJS10_CPA09g01962 [Acorus calamus]|uniref:MYB-CC type transcription factor LHEQLE-containing domain-containing protein n=1 Tax=Acorus calamus TaxID=4465 RepID=A0AAV9E2P1_ACOCL|nr:hypothetical protein QJS10_CPA09g01962 [Acorus calamus]